MEIGILRRQGKSLRAIAGMTGTSVNTVRKYLAAGGPPRYKPRPPKPSKLDPFKDYLMQRVEAARPHWIPATVLAREIREQGFGGCEKLVSRFVRSLRPVAKDDPLVRFETAPGQQLQVDWIEFKRERLSAFVATLGHSRAAYIEYVTDERIDTLVACHVHAFEFFGGVPREVLYDNVKTVVLERDGYGPGVHRFHPTVNVAQDFPKSVGRNFPTPSGSVIGRNGIRRSPSAGARAGAWARAVRLLWEVAGCAGAREPGRRARASGTNCLRWR